MRKNSDEESNASKRKKSEKKNKSTQNNGKITHKAKSGFAKIKNSIQSTVNTKKIMQFVRKSTRTIPHLLLTKQQSKALLPKLQKIMLPESIKNDHYSSNKSKFEQIGHQLTQSMVMFKRNTQNDSNDIWAIDLQTQKCYKKIPAFYFQNHVNLEQLAQHLTLTKNHKLMRENFYMLEDYLEEVKFNIGQQTSAKIKIFMNFIMCMDSIQGLVNINLDNLQKTRKFICILRDIIVSRAVRINSHREKKQKISQALDIIQTFKKMKQIQSKLATQISLGHLISHDPKSKSGSLYTQYCTFHNIILKKFCCKTGKNLCKYWDINYFIEKGYQDNFMKMIRSYLFEVINCQMEVENFKKAFIINKKNFMTTPSSSGHAQFVPNMLDQSYDVDAYDHVELITKIHIEKEIIVMFEQGMSKYNFSTELLEKELKDFLSSYVNRFAKQALCSIDPAESKLALKELSQNHDSNYLGSQKFREKMAKMGWIYFDKMMEMMELRFEYLNSRLLSLFQKLFAKAAELQNQQPERYQILCAYLYSLIHFQLMQTDQYLSKMLKLRLKENEISITLFKSKDEIAKQFEVESQSMKKMVKHCKKWLGHIQTAQKSYPLCKKQIQKGQNKSEKSLKLIENLWSPKMQTLKAILVKNTYELLHKKIVSRDLREKLEDDNWQIIEIKADIYDDIGYIIGGKQFLQEEERHQRSLLSNSLLMERSMSEMERERTAQYNKQEYSSKFKINPNYITIGKYKFRIVSSTEHVIKFLRRYLELYDDLMEIDKKDDLQAKLTELLLMYVQFIRDLILKGEALKLGKINAKSITAKHLVITYIQLRLIDIFFRDFLITGRVGLSQQECATTKEKIDVTQTEIRKKYYNIMQLRILDSFQSINPKNQSILETEQMLSIPKNISASIQLFSNLFLNQSEYQLFLNNSSWASELLNKINKLSKAKEIQMKVFSFLYQQLSPYQVYIPLVLIAIRGVIN